MQGEERRSLSWFGYSDSDMASDVDDHKSTRGMIYFLSGSAICWQSTKQKVVVLSSCEAEYIAASTAITQGVWLARLMEELMGREGNPPMLYVDNKATISLTSKSVQIGGLSRLTSSEQRNSLRHIHQVSCVGKFEEFRSKIGDYYIKTYIFSLFRLFTFSLNLVEFCF